jgi:hypothetical protein
LPALPPLPALPSAFVVPNSAPDVPKFPLWAVAVALDPDVSVLAFAVAELPSLVVSSLEALVLPSFPLASPETLAVVPPVPETSVNNPPSPDDPQPIASDNGSATANPSPNLNMANRLYYAGCLRQWTHRVKLPRLLAIDPSDSFDTPFCGAGPIYARGGTWAFFSRRAGRRGRGALRGCPPFSSAIDLTLRRHDGPSTGRFESAS